MFIVKNRIIFYIISVIGLLYAPLLALILILIISTLTMYVPQSIVLDEKSIGESIEDSISFWLSNPVVSLGILVTSSILLFIIFLIEFILDMANLPGIIVSFALVLVVLVPFVEQMKSYSFILKNALIRAPEMHHANYHKSAPVKLNGTRLREKHPGGKI